MDYSSRAPFTELWRREIGPSRPLQFSRSFTSSQALVSRIDFYCKLENQIHDPDVFHFNPTGDAIASAAREQIKLQNWALDKEIFSFDSGHVTKMTDVRIMPYTNDTVVLTSSRFGKVRHHVLSNDGRVNSKSLGKREYGVDEIALDPGNLNIFYSCGGVHGCVQHFDLRCNSSPELFRIFRTSKGGVEFLDFYTCIAIDPHNPNHIALGGRGSYARVFDVRNLKLWRGVGQPVNTLLPAHLRDMGNLHITGLAYSSSSELLASYFEDHIYLYPKNSGPGYVVNPPRYSGHSNERIARNVCFFGGNDEYVVSGSNCGHAYIWAKKSGELIRRMKVDTKGVESVQAHPSCPILASRGEDGPSINLWAPVGDNVDPLSARTY